MKSEYANFLYQLKFALQSTDPTKQLEAFESVRIQYNKISKKSPPDLIRNLADLLKELSQVSANAFLDELKLTQPILTSNYYLHPSIKELLTKRDEYEAHQELMGEIVKSIRQHPKFSMEEKEEVYCRIRNLVCTHYLINHEIIENKIQEEFIDITYRLYTEIDLHDEILTLCPHCTRPIIKEGDCTDVCNFYQKRSPLPLIEKRINPEERYFALSDGVYQFTNLPSIGERYLFKKLQNQFLMSDELVVKMYPRVDEMDILLDNGIIQLELDIKDYVNPMGLVNFFEREGYQAFKIQQETEQCTRYLVIPDHRVAIYNEDKYKDYIYELKNGLKTKYPAIKVIQENELQGLILDYFDLTR